ncbi:MAG: 2-succinyl-6-hydroxy-2,4-cyclohexadiene-1-carboxylate synthase [Dehalococcoidales bacterium]|nr:2-succinyl-6-hydroxy-2,4-cyclohexadiene-1-carboxylate synthase [Dehalococcoidales bacterium]
MRIALNALNNLCLNVEQWGNGLTPIIALHGFTGNASTWVSFSGAAGKGYTVICPELPGHGKSDAPGLPELYDLEHTLHALAEMADKLGVRKAHWLGYSMGGRIALAAALSLSDRMLSLTVESGSAGIATDTERKARVRRDTALANTIERNGMEAFVDYWESLPLWESQSRLPIVVQEKLRAERLANNPVGLANSLRGIGTGAQPYLLDRLAEITVPSLFIAGQDDTKFSATARRMHAAAPGSRLCIVPEIGHAVHLEQPDIFNRTVLDFIGTVDGSTDIPQDRSRSRLSR